MKIQSRGGFSVGQRVRMKSENRTGVVTGIEDLSAFIKEGPDRRDFSLRVKLDGNQGVTNANAAYFEPVSS